MMGEHDTPVITRLARALQTSGISFMVLGGLGSSRGQHGSAVLGLVVDAGPARLPDLLAICAEISLIPLPDDPDRFARERFLLPTRDAITGARCDLLLSTIPYQRQAIGRAVRLPLGGGDIPFATPEDQIIHWLFAEHGEGLEQARTVVRTEGGRLDWDYLDAWARAFASVPGREVMPEQVVGLRAAAGDRGPVRHRS
jgi:hypothetical protein